MEIPVAATARSEDRSPPLADLATTALFLDMDGTLLDLAETPDGVAVPAALPEVLLALRRRTGGALALVTGRNIETVDRLFAPLELPVAGVHGAELRLPGRPVRKAAAMPELERLKAKLAAFVESRPGLLLEDKGEAVAVHFRAAPEYGGEVEARLRALASSAGPDLSVQPGKMVVELRPAGTNKGAAVRSFLEHPPFVGRAPLVIGDDWTDEAAFEAANAAGGRSIRVGPRDRPTAATERLGSPAEVRAWLAAHV